MSSNLEWVINLLKKIMLILGCLLGGVSISLIYCFIAAYIFPDSFGSLSAVLVFVPIIAASLFLGFKFGKTRAQKCMVFLCAFFTDYVVLRIAVMIMFVVTMSDFN